MKKNKSVPLNSDSTSSWIQLLPLIFIVSIVPIILRLKPIPLDSNVAYYWATDVNYDFFSYYKSVAFIIATIVSFWMVISNYLTSNFKIKKLKLYMPMLLFSLTAIISTLLSDYKGISLFGFPDRYEGLFVLLGYMIVVFTTINSVNDEKQGKLVVYSLLISASFISLIGVSQYLGMDIFRTTFAKYMVLPSDYLNNPANMTFNFGPYTIYNTMYNPNNVGSYMAMLFPISLTLFITSEDRKSKIIFYILNCLFFINWIGCKSRAGWVGGTISIIVILFFLRRYIRRNQFYISGLLLSFILIFTGMNYISQGNLLGKVSLEGTTQSIEQTQESDALVDLKIGDNRINIITQKTNLSIVSLNNEIKFLDQNEKELSYYNVGQDGNTTLIIDDVRYKDYQFPFSKDLTMFNVVKEPLFFSFQITNQGFKVADHRGQFIDLVAAKSWGFEGREFMGSSRGYIWSRSLPLIKNTLFYGHGPDTFAFYFPQHDIVAKTKFLSTHHIVVDKPHNFYLQLAINTGLISLLTILGLFAMYSISSFKLYLSQSKIYKINPIGLACFAAFIGYIISAVFNDSVISVAPVFWVILGIGISMNHLSSVTID